MILVRILSSVVLLLAAQTALANDIPRFFDVVAPEGHQVEQVDGAAVLRLPGQRYGTVLSYLPESAETGWIRLAVLNTSAEPFKAKTADVSAHYGLTGLKVHKTSALIREARILRAEIRAMAPFVEGKTLDTLTWTNRSMDRQLRAIAPPKITGQSDIYYGSGQYVPTTSLEREIRKVADDQFAALRQRLFPNAEIVPGGFSLGDIRVDLPPRRLDQPTEFVLRMDFAGEPMEVTFRERSVPSVDVGEIEAAGSQD